MYRALFAFAAAPALAQLDHFAQFDVSEIRQAQRSSSKELFSPTPLQMIAQVQYSWNITGLAVAMIDQGTIVFEQGFGLADVATKVLVTPATHFQIASNSKAFTAALCYRAAELGALDL